MQPTRHCNFPSSAVAEGTDGNRAVESRKHTIYAVCPDPQCHRMYKTELRDGFPIAQYPTRCKHQRNGRVCGTILTRSLINAVKIQVPLTSVAYVRVPIKLFVHVDWFAGLLSHSGNKDDLETCERKHPVDEMLDVFEGHAFVNLIRRESERAFLPKPCLNSNSPQGQ